MIGSCLVLSGAAPAVAQEEDPEWVLDYTTEAPVNPATPEFDRRNLEAVEALDAEGQCLFRYSVYPQSAALAADEFGPWEVAADVFRAEILRVYSHELSGVSFDYNEQQEIISATIHAVEGTSAASRTLEALLRPLGSKFDKAMAQVESDGVDIKLASDAVQSLQRGCAVQNFLHDGPLFEALGTNGFSVTSVVEEKTGVLQIRVPKEWLDGTRAWIKQFDVDATIEESEAAEYTGRGMAYVPKFGGSFLKNASATVYCSNAFRINTTALLIAGHCGYQNWYSTHVSYTIYSGTTSSSSSLTSAGIDSMLLYGSTYSNRVWMGDALGQSTKPAIGIVTESEVVIGGYYLASNGLTGQGTLVMDSKWAYGTFQNRQTGAYETRYQLYTATAVPGYWNGCTSGDSGSPWMLYVPGGASYPAIATLTGSWGAGCAATSMSVVSYLFGGATIG